MGGGSRPIISTTGGGILLDSPGVFQCPPADWGGPEAWVRMGSPAPDGKDTGWSLGGLLVGSTTWITNTCHNNQFCKRTYIH